MSGEVAGKLSAGRALMPRLKLPYIDLIWRVRGEVPLDPKLTPAETFARLEPLLRTPGTTLSADGNTLAYTKDNPNPQDKLATFTRGRMWIEPAGAGAVLRFDLFSHALLMCFLAPLLFLGFAQLAVALNAWEASGPEAAEKAEKKDEKPKPVKKLNPVDEFLGAPAPEDPNKKKKDEKKEDEGRHSPDQGYFMAGLFALIYLVGRWLEPWLVRRRLRAALASVPETATPA
ncbi:hypothetical protein [Porphyrobacter sp. ULC335]|uniref:hypothetical protein n=1 Tax=Porphyrobacter sp. ULC335 TaxID=2854260 RepID=UPI00221E6C24|nr:hypothetical protein [Porphyrobacter sp. ULC335]UYV15358.1 hypothetical protein KVF90_14760 [Porphyrobacter sp. ULC335]